MKAKDLEQLKRPRLFHPEVEQPPPPLFTLSVTSPSFIRSPAEAQLA